MSDELKNQTNETQEPEPMPEMPDGRGLKYEEVQALLHAKHKTSVGTNDPILMLVTILNVYLGELENSHNRHDAAMAKIIAAKTAEYISGVRQTTDTLTKTLSDASVEGIRKTFDDQAGRLKAFENSLFWCSALISLSALINAALYILK